MVGSDAAATEGHGPSHVGADGGSWQPDEHDEGDGQYGPRRDEKDDGGHGRNGLVAVHEILGVLRDGASMRVTATYNNAILCWK